ncbi:transcription factor HES-5-like [Syngnathoides biaculeatus]|uniref:transcription factor HES-5-like n=1 Tax=Syngnathoides biaculeatus TaxID=300417 RepID=UPI002ADE7334|nr:transcription factor HES-5-like [Syngnathoides biaculeatus]
MAPAISLQDSHAALTHKVRKPLVEKFRRERINSSIEQLKSLLAPEFLRQRPDSKMEKADVLEMSVRVLRRLQSARRGYAKCAGEAARFLRQEERLGPLGSTWEGRTREEDSSPPGKEESSAQSGPWRPW